MTPTPALRLVAQCAAFSCCAILLVAGCKRTPVVSADQKVLDALAPLGAVGKLGPDGRVVDLVLNGRQVTDEALEQVRTLTELKALSLYQTSVTDGGLAHLKELKKLEELGLGNNKLSRRGLAHLEKMPTLRHMWLSEHDKLTAKEITDFKAKAVPGLTVHMQ